MRTIIKDVYMMVVIVVDMIALTVNAFMKKFVPLEVSVASLVEFCESTGSTYIFDTRSIKKIIWFLLAFTHTVENWEHSFHRLSANGSFHGLFG